MVKNYRSRGRKVETIKPYLTIRALCFLRNLPITALMVVLLMYVISMLDTAASAFLVGGINCRKNKVRSPQRNLRTRK